MKTNMEVEAHLYIFLTSTLDGCDNRFVFLTSVSQSNERSIT